MPDAQLYFFIGTVAELIKVMPVMRTLAERGIPFSLIATGQHALKDQDLFTLSRIGRPDIVLNERHIGNSAPALCLWFLETLVKGAVQLKRYFRPRSSKSILIIHGDTVSTLMGALLGKLYGLKVAHIEAGYRSFDFFQPFPEELDRYFTSFLADVHFCPNDAALRNVASRRGRKLNTGFNTAIDSLNCALTNATAPKLYTATDGDYFVFILHRQENLFNAAFVKNVIRAVLARVQHTKCVFVMHSLTRAILSELHLFDDIATNRNITIVDRLPYLQFVSLLSASTFLLTDGGGNQQECYYLGKPCLILRNVTEGSEGLGCNAVLYNDDINILNDFVSNYTRFIFPAISPFVRPSDVIADTLAELIKPIGV